VPRGTQPSAQSRRHPSSFSFSESRDTSSSREAIPSRNFTQLTNTAHRWFTLIKSRIASPGYAVTHLCAKEVQVHAPHTKRSITGGAARRASERARQARYPASVSHLWFPPPHPLPP
jgi:hypothetical protein